MEEGVKFCIKIKYSLLYWGLMEGKATELEQVKRLSHVVLNFQILASI
jgi:hypothetical protein